MRLEQILLDDQKRIRGLFRQVQVLDQRAPAMIPGVAKELFLDLQLHALAELDQVFPELKTDVGLDSFARGDLEQAREAQNEILREIEVLDSMSPDAGNWEQVLGDFRRTVELYFDHELRQVFPLVRRIAKPKADELSTRILDIRRSALSRPEHRPARPSVAQNPSGGEQKRKTG